MKYNYLFLLLATLTSGPVFSQSDWSTGTTWYYRMRPFSSQDIFPNKHVITGDTVIQGKPCQIMERDYTTDDTRPETEFLFVQNDSISFYDTDSETFKLLYDFTMEVGDTAYFPLWIYMPANNQSNTDNYKYSIVVEAIDTIEIGGIHRKRMFVLAQQFQDNFPWANERPFVFIEGIGSIGNFFIFNDNGLFDDRYNVGLRCFEVNGETLYQDYFPEEDCDEIIMPSSTDEDVESNGIHIYPNPVRDVLQINIQPNVRNQKIIVHNVQGQPVFSQLLSPSQSTISISLSNELNQGVYFLYIKEDGQPIRFGGKFVKM